MRDVCGRSLYTIQSPSQQRYFSGLIYDEVDIVSIGCVCDVPEHISAMWCYSVGGLLRVIPTRYLMS